MKSWVRVSVFVVGLTCLVLGMLIFPLAALFITLSNPAPGWNDYLIGLVVTCVFIGFLLIGLTLKDTP